MVILIAEDNAAIRLGLQMLLKTEHDVIACADGEEALRHLEGSAIDLVITDYQMPNVDGLELIKRGKAISPSTFFLMMTAHASVDHAVKAIQIGADDYITKPFDVTEVNHRLRRIEELRSVKIERAIRTEANRDGKAIIGESALIADERQFAKAAASATSPVLLTGPSGSGKKLLARTIHESGQRSIFPYITVDCSLADENSLEADLFGCERNEVTGTPARSGKLEMTSRGTLVLDEVSALPPKLQSKIASALDSGTFQRAGGSRPIHFNSRLISISRRPLTELVAQGKFREDLYFQLKVLNFNLTPLSSRPEDVRPLIKYYWSKLAAEIKFTLSLAPETRKQLEEYPYPGNVRELQNVLERLAVVENNRGGIVGPERLPHEFQEMSVKEASKKSLAEQMESTELSILKNALDQTAGDEEGAAKSLNITLENFRTRLQTLREKQNPSEKAAA